jgi:hypothetical protein
MGLTPDRSTEPVAVSLVVIVLVLVGLVAVIPVLAAGTRIALRLSLIAAAEGVYELAALKVRR